MLETASDLAVGLAGAPSTADVVVAPCRHDEQYPDRAEKDPARNDADGPKDDSPVILSGNTWRRSATIRKEHGTDRRYIADASSFWARVDEADRQRITEALGAKPAVR